RGAGAARRGRGASRGSRRGADRAAGAGSTGRRQGVGRRARRGARLRLAGRRRRDGSPGQAPRDAAHRARGGPAARAADRSSAAAGAGSPARLAGLGAERKAETVTEISVLQLVSPPRQVPELIAALRAWEPGGIGSWVLAAKAQLPLTAEECRLLAQKIDALELSAMEFERVIALVGLSLGLDCRRRLTVGKTIYGKDREVDVLFRDARNGNRLAVEAKYQRVTGTADEKLPYAALNLPTLPLPGVIVYGGGGFHQGALHWLCANTRATDFARLSVWPPVLI